MTHYEPNTPRTGLALAAVAIATITFGLFVVVPSGLESAATPAGAVEAKQSVTPASTAAVASPSRTNAVPARRNRA